MRSATNDVLINAAQLGKVIDCASQARDWVHALSVLYRNGQCDSTGLCAHGSARLAELLRERLINCDIHVLDDSFASVNHCYVEVNGLIVDVTADQFPQSNAPHIVVNKRSVIDVVLAPWWARGRVVSSRSELIDRLRDLGWPDEQIPAGFPAG